MKERINLINLYDTYKNLLTKKQQEYFEYYYFEDNSLSEIADNLGVSKTIVGKTINGIETKLLEYETKLGMYKLINGIKSLIDTCEYNDLKKDLENI